MSAAEPIFVDLSDSKPTEIESLCMKCRENVSFTQVFAPFFLTYVI